MDDAGRGVPHEYVNVHEQKDVSKRPLSSKEMSLSITPQEDLHVYARASVCEESPEKHSWYHGKIYVKLKYLLLQRIKLKNELMFVIY